MKTELESQDIEAIAQRVAELLKPILADNAKNEDEIMNIEQASEFLKTTNAQIYQWVSKTKYGFGNFPYKKSGKQLRFSKNELIKWMEPNKSR